jgi:hypothetical protein
MSTLTWELHNPNQPVEGGGMEITAFDKGYHFFELSHSISGNPEKVTRKKREEKSLLRQNMAMTAP